MRLSFSVLWFDDSEEYFDSLDIQPLEDQIRSWGFEPVIKTVSTAEDFLGHSPFDIYDLIIVDRNLEGYASGQEFIADIRSNAIYTEVIFYTAGNATDLWEAIREKELEGVFVSSRSEIISKIIRIGRQSIRKVLDLENMRGIVMAEVGELDRLLDQIIELGMDGLSADQRSSVFKRFHKQATEQNQANTRSLDAFIESPDVKGMLDLCDSDKRWQNFNRLRKTHDKLKASEVAGDYVGEILRPRNFLAHGKPEPHESGGYRFRFRGGEYHFDDHTSVELRQTILKYKSSFRNLIDLVNEH